MAAAAVGIKFETYFLCVGLFTFGFSILTADALRCYQCNSLTDLNCEDLKASPKAIVQAEKYLIDCAPSPSPNNTQFCRKTSYYINYENSNRIIRSCGWLRDESHNKHLSKGSCIHADEEGLIERICICDTDGCNSAPNDLSASKLLCTLCASIVMLFVKKFAM